MPWHGTGAAKLREGQAGALLKRSNLSRVEGRAQLASDFANPKNGARGVTGRTWPPALAVLHYLASFY